MIEGRRGGAGGSDDALEFTLVGAAPLSRPRPMIRRRLFDIRRCAACALLAYGLRTNSTRFDRLSMPHSSTCDAEQMGQHRQSAQDGGSL